MSHLRLSSRLATEILIVGVVDARCGVFLHLHPESAFDEPCGGFGCQREASFGGAVAGGETDCEATAHGHGVGGLFERGRDFVSHGFPLMFFAVS